MSRIRPPALGSTTGATTLNKPDQEAGPTRWFPSLPRHLPAIAIPVVALELFGLVGCKNIEIGPPSSPSCCHGGGR
jgi:hypothetical protein